MHVIKVAMAVVVSKCNNVINYQSCSANIGIYLRNSSIQTVLVAAVVVIKIPVVVVVVKIVVLIK